MTEGDGEAMARLPQEREGNDKDAVATTKDARTRTVKKQGMGGGKKEIASYSTDCSASRLSGPWKRGLNSRVRHAIDE